MVAPRRSWICIRFSCFRFGFKLIDGLAWPINSTISSWLCSHDNTTRTAKYNIRSRIGCQNDFIHTIFFCILISSAWRLNHKTYPNYCVCSLRCRGIFCFQWTSRAIGHVPNALLYVRNDWRWRRCRPRYMIAFFYKFYIRHAHQFPKKLVPLTSFIQI